MNSMKLAAAIAILTCFAATQAHGAPRAIYNPINGHVEFADIGGLRGVSLISSFSGHLSPHTATKVPGVIDVFSPNELNWLLPGFAPFENPFSFSPGHVITVGTPASEITFRYAVTGAGDSFVELRNPVVIVPEPSTIALGSLPLLALAALRCRK